jgi:Bacterial PH domain
MQPTPDQFNAYNPVPEQTKRKGMPWWGWLIIGVVVLVIMPCFGCIGWVAYIGAVGPETSVYTGNEVPQRFIDTATDVGALEPGEDIRFFYSDAVTDIRNGFYFVSDKRVVIYNDYDSADPLTIVEFDEIEDVSLSRDTSFVFDSEIYIELDDGTPISFPVSSEKDGDVRFLEAIEEGRETVLP